MPRFQILKPSLIVLVLLMTPAEICLAAPTNTELSVCGIYEFVGVLSNDLKKQPTLSAFSDKGVPVTIVLKAEGLKSLELMGLRGKTIKATVKVTKAQSSGVFNGVTDKFVLAPPTGLGIGTGTPKARIVSRKAKNCP